MRERVLKQLFLRWRRRGDGRALAAVFDGTARELHGVAAHLVPGTGEAEDLVQLTFLRAMERAASFDEEAELLPWLHGILWREAMAARRRRKTRPAEEGPEPLDAREPGQALEERELPTAVRAALGELPSPYREVVTPYLLEEQSPQAIADALARAPGTVRVQLARGLERLRAKLPREYAAFGLLGATRGLASVRTALLRELGLASAPGPLATGALTAWTAFAITPLLWPMPALVCAGTLALARPELFPFLSTEPQPVEPVPLVESDSTEDPMLSALVSLAALSTTPVQDQREEVAVQTVAEKVAALDALVGELLVLAQPDQAEADVAWAGLLAAKARVDAELRARRQAAQSASAAAQGDRERWIAALSQLDDEAARAQALREIETALSSGSPSQQLSACGALSGSGQVQFDKAPFRPLLLPLAAGASGELRVAALYALHSTVRTPEDRALALALADDPTLCTHASAPYLVMLFCENDLTGAAGAAVLRMLAAAGPEGRRSMINGIWGARVSPELEAYVLELSRSPDRDEQYETMYFALSTFVPKSEAVVRRLIEFLPSTDPNVYDRALWGISYGIEPAQGPLVLQAARELFEARSDVNIQVSCLGLIGQHAGPELEPWLAGLAADTRRPAAVREAAGEALAALRSR